MKLPSFFDRFNNFSILATNIAFIYINLKKKYGHRLDERQLCTVTGVIDMQYYFANNIFSINQLRDFDEKISIKKDETERIADIVETIQIMIFMEQFKDVPFTETVEIVLSQRQTFIRAIKKIQASSETNTRQKRSYLNDIDVVMTDPNLEDFRKSMDV